MTITPFQRLVFHLPALVLVVWGAVLVHVSVTGRIALLLAPIFRPFVLVAGGLLVLLALGHVLYFQPAPPPRVRRGQEPPPGPPFLAEMNRWLMLLVPVLIAAVLAPSRYSANIIAARGVQTAPAARNSTEEDDRLLADLRKVVADLPPDAPLELTLYDIIALAVVPGAGEALGKRPVLVKGQISPGAGEDSFRLVDIMVFCCAADAMPMGVTVRGEPPAGTQAMDWVVVSGPLHFSTELGRHQVEMSATTIERDTAPADAFVPPGF